MTLTLDWSAMLHGTLPILIAAIAYPIGNQLVTEARHKRIGIISAETGELLGNPFTCILLAALGSLPWWVFLVLWTWPPLPTLTEIRGTGLIAVAAGIIATGIFVFARNRARRDGHALTAVDSTQSAEVVFTLFIEIAWLGAALPELVNWSGLLLIAAGLIGFAYRPPTTQPRVPSAH
jgi:hypothetical protein